MREVRGSFETELREFNGEADHVHLLVHYPPKVALSKLINSLKGVSSRYLRAEYTGRINRIGMGSAFWSRSYFAGSCGGAPLTVIRQYIEGQKRPV
ncbi:IS200/IS605 family transposase, partial [Streptomyces sp. NPDC090445]|uniref:IS200/IS605 family transposase n=1 Tax=Streptomyces sp. NPDC090445 TaxID=3365963 RepID=UPI0038013D98